MSATLDSRFLLFALALGLTPIAATAAEFHKGVNYTHAGRGGGGYGTPASAQTIAQLSEAHIDCISLNPFGYMETLRDTSVRTINERDGHERDDAMARDIAEAHRHGIRVMLKPHLWIRRGDWAGEIEFQTDEDWDAWFASYGAMMKGYAAFAEKNKVEWLCVGVELKATSGAQPERWRRLIAQIRESYSGNLIYNANWDEFERITWWDALDAVGISAYFPLSDEEEPTLDDLCTGARFARARIDAFHRRVGRPIMFTEVGFRSMEGAAARPWEYREKAPPDQELQARCYEAVFEVFWDAPWLRGMYWWKWFSNASITTQTFDRDPFSPRNKPALAVMTEWFSKRR